MSESRRIVDAAGRTWTVTEAPSSEPNVLDFREEDGSTHYRVRSGQPLAELGDEMLLVHLEREWAKDHPSA